jgi:hypothetical protein
MKRTLLFLFGCIMVCNLFAQTADLKAAVARYGHASMVTATAVKTKHNAAVKDNAKYSGTLTMKRPSSVAISVNGGKDQLVMQGSTFTMVTRGKKHVTNSKTNTQFASFQKVFEYILSGGTSGNLASLSDLKMSKSGSNIVLTITPVAANKKAKRRSPFTSFVLTINEKTSALVSLRMNQRGKNFTEYKFSNFAFK